MSCRTKFACITMLAVFLASHVGCGPAGKALQKVVQNGAKRGAKQSTKGSKYADDFWKNSKRLKSVRPGAKSFLVTSAAKTKAFKAFDGAAASTARCGQRLANVNQSYESLRSTSRVAVRILILKFNEYNAQLEQIDKRLSDPSLTDADAKQLQMESKKVAQKMERIESLTAKYG